MASDSLWSIALLAVFELSFVLMLLARRRGRPPEKPLIQDVYRLAGRARRVG